MTYGYLVTKMRGGSRTHTSGPPGKRRRSHRSRASCEYLAEKASPSQFGHFSVFCHWNAMISLKVISKRQRLAERREGSFCRLLGPGIVFLNLPGRQYTPVSIGDHCLLVTSGQARFCEALLPVELQGSAKSTMLFVTGFRHNTILVAAERVEASRVAGEPAPTQKAAPRFTRRGFWIGLPAILFFAIISWMGVWYAADQILTERTVYLHGVLTTGTVAEKIYLVQTKEGEQEHYVTYTFHTPANGMVFNTIRIDPTVWNHLTQNGPIAIRYVPDKPELNLPDGWHMENFYYLAGGAAAAGAVLFSIALIGMLIKKLSGGYPPEGSKGHSVP